MVRIPRWPLLIAVSFVALAAQALAHVTPRPGESAVVRWLRVLIDHPCRSALALSLLFWGTWALRGPQLTSNLPERPARGRDSASIELE